MVCAVRKKGSLLPCHRFINAFNSHKNKNSSYLSQCSFVLLRLCVHKLVYMHLYVYKPTCMRAYVSTRGYRKTTSTAVPQKLLPCFLRQGLSCSREPKQAPEICFSLSPSAGLQAEPPHRLLFSVGSGD